MTEITSNPDTGQSFNQRVFTIREAAEILRVSKPTLWREWKAGRLDTFTVGTRRFVTGAALLKRMGQ